MTVIEQEVILRTAAEVRRYMERSGVDQMAFADNEGRHVLIERHGARDRAFYLVDPGNYATRRVIRARINGWLPLTPLDRVADALAELRAERDLFREVALRQVRYRRALARQHRAAIEAVRDELQDMADSLDEHVTQADVARVLHEVTARLSARIRAQGKGQGV